MRLLLLPLLLALLVPGQANAQQNRAYPVQGVLTDAADAPIDGTLPVQFNLYTAETGGVAAWSETQDVVFEDGLFSIFLGDSTSLDPSLFASNEGLWLGISVDSDPEMDRVFIGSTPYAGYAELAGNVPTTLAELSGSLPGSALPSGVLQGPSSCSPGEVVTGVDSSGAVECETDQDSTYSGANFATSSQSCTTGAVVEVDASGNLVCAVPLAGQGCGVGDVVTGFDALGDPTCEPAYDLLTGGTGSLALVDLTLTGALSATDATFSGDATVTGDLDIQGNLTINGQSPGYPSNPQFLLGSVDSFCNNSSTNVGWVTYPTRFAEPPVFVAGIDESLNNNGATWMRIERNYRNRAGIRCNGPADSIDWLAIEPGAHTIDGKTVMAGTVAGATSGSAVFFPTTFSAPPVVLIFPDETVNQSGATVARIINTVTTGGFEYWVDSTADNLHWVAFEAGEYTAGPWHFYAGSWTPNNACSPSASDCQFQLPSGMFTDAVDLITTINDTNNSGASWIRSKLLTPDLVSIRLSGNTENLYYLAWERL